MHRLAALILILIVPLQFAWSAVAAVHGHVGKETPVLGMHAHDHEHDHQQQTGGHHDPRAALPGDADPGHGDDGHHASHYHPVFAYILPDAGLTLGISCPSGLIRHAPSAFISRIPPLLDRPPLAFA